MMTAEELMNLLKSGKIATDEFLRHASGLSQPELAKLTDLLLKWAYRQDN
jgi:hypothetical protein